MSAPAPSVGADRPYEVFEMALYREDDSVELVGAYDARIGRDPGNPVREAGEHATIWAVAEAEGGEQYYDLYFDGPPRQRPFGTVAESALRRSDRPAFDLSGLRAQPRSFWDSGR